MLCKTPYFVGRAPVPCGRCLPCKILRKQNWTNRQRLESWCYKRNSFITLTYSDEHLPRDASLAPDDLTLFMKKFRDAIKPDTIRFYAVGEYGSETFRPHYHLSFFGLGAECADLVQEKWGKGHTSTYEFNSATAAYVCSYMVKAMTKLDDERLFIEKIHNRFDPLLPIHRHRYPEFSRMSNRPGIGAPYAKEIAHNIMSSKSGVQYVKRFHNVPPYLVADNKHLYFDSYILKCIKKELNFPPSWLEENKQTWATAVTDEMYAMHENAVTRKKDTPYTSTTLIQDRDGNKIASMEARYLIQTSGKQTL